MIIGVSAEKLSTQLDWAGQRGHTGELWITRYKQPDRKRYVIVG